MGILAWAATTAFNCGSGNACLARHITARGRIPQHRQYGSMLRQGFAGAMVRS
jgi:hypothetical protein